MVRALVVMGTFVALSALAGAGANAHTDPHGPPPPRECDSARTANGGIAAPIYYWGRANRCHTARKIARRATGRGYRAWGYVCLRENKRLPVDYSCRRNPPETGGHIEFLYVPKGHPRNPYLTPWSRLP